MECKITRLGRGQFRADWTIDEKNIFLELDFNPLLRELLVRGIYSKNTCFLHFQGKPKGLRRFAVYDSHTDDYVCIDEDDNLIINAPCRLLCINEEINTTLPTSVMCFLSTRLIKPENSPYYLVLA